MINQYKYTDKQQEELLSSITIIVDTREKENKNIIDYFEKKKIRYNKKTLDYGDYSFFLPQNIELSIPRDLYFDKKIAIERKMSLEELSGNFSQHRDRSEKEFGLYKGKI